VTLAVDDEQNLLGIVIENMPLGLLEHYCPSARFFYRCQENCRFSKIAASDFERILSFVAAVHERADDDSGLYGHLRTGCQQ
jgi:hypothetical protein